MNLGFLALIPAIAQAHRAAFPVATVEASLVSVQHTAYLMTAPNVDNVSELHIINTSGGAPRLLWHALQKGVARCLLQPRPSSPRARRLPTVVSH